jgi:uncharacterized protein (DUF302 family)
VKKAQSANPSTKKKKKREKRTGDVAEVVEHLPSKLKANTIVIFSEFPNGQRERGNMKRSFNSCYVIEGEIDCL